MKITKKLVAFISEALDENLTVYAAQATFYLVLSVIPFMMILLSAAQYFLPIEKSSIISLLPATMSYNVKNFLCAIIDEFFKKPYISHISINALTILWSASRGLAATERGIKLIYHIPKRRFFVTNLLLSLIYTIVFVAILLLSLAIIVFGKSMFGFLNQHIPWFDINLSILEYILFFCFSFLFFTVVYASFSSWKIPFRYHMSGAIFTILGWVLFSLVFSIYINNFANYSKIYGSLTAIVLLMLWMYSCMIIMLFGAKINIKIIELKGLVYK